MAKANTFNFIIPVLKNGAKILPQLLSRGW